MKASREVAQMLLDRQMELLAKGIEGSKDIMSILSEFILYRAQLETMASSMHQLEQILPRIPRRN